MDDTLRNRTAGRHEAATDVANDPAAATRSGRANVSRQGELGANGPRAGSRATDSPWQLVGRCVNCGEQTEHVVKFDDKAQFLCVPCGRAIREAA
jgi:hypothetical protein